MAHLITIADAEGHSSPLQSDLAKATGASTINFKGLRASLDRLHEHSWITWRKGTRVYPVSVTATKFISRISPERRPMGISQPFKEKRVTPPRFLDKDQKIAWLQARVDHLLEVARKQGIEIRRGRLALERIREAIASLGKTLTPSAVNKACEERRGL